MANRAERYQDQKDLVEHLLDDNDDFRGAFGRERDVAPATWAKAYGPRSYSTETPPWRTWNRRGVEALVRTAMNDFSEVTGHHLPWNLSTHGPWVELQFDMNWCQSATQADEMVGTAARLTGWLRHAAKFSTLVRLLKATTSDRGMNSPRTTIDLYRFVATFRSPGRADDVARKVHVRANEILEGYGLRVSWQAVGAGMTRYPHRIGRAAREAAAAVVLQYAAHRGCHLQKDWYGKKDASMDILIRGRGVSMLEKLEPGARAWVEVKIREGQYSCVRDAAIVAANLPIDTNDDVRLVVDPETVEVFHGIESMEGYTDRGNIVVLCRQLATGRTYHWSGGRSEGRRHVVKKVLAEWQRQVKFEREKLAQERGLLAIFERENISHLVTFEDARAAGNCQPGIQAWLRSNGMAGQTLVPAHVLILKMGNNQRVRSTLMAARRRIQQATQ